WNGRAVRGRAGRARHSRRDDRRGPGAEPPGFAMNGAHDLGGMHGFGPVVIEPDEPVFHAEWERRMFALNLAMGVWRRWNHDRARFAREQMPAAGYRAPSYCEPGLWGCEWRWGRQGSLTRGELSQRQPEGAGAGVLVSVEPQPGVLRPDGVPRLLQNRRAARVDDPVPPKFKAGDEV